MIKISQKTKLIQKSSNNSLRKNIGILFIRWSSYTLSLHLPTLMLSYIKVNKKLSWKIGIHKIFF